MERGALAALFSVALGSCKLWLRSAQHSTVEIISTAQPENILAAFHNAFSLKSSLVFNAAIAYIANF